MLSLEQQIYKPKDIPPLTPCHNRQKNWSNIFSLFQRYRIGRYHWCTNRSNTNSAFLAQSEMSAHEEFGNGKNILHDACRNQAPAKVIDLLQKNNFRYACQFDDEGRTPLHVAAANGAPVDVISILLKEFPVAASMQDNFGRTPLILACFKSRGGELCEIYGSENKTTEHAPSHRVIHELCTASGHSVILEDDEDMSALEHAIVNTFDSTIVSLLQKATMKARKRLSLANNAWIKKGICEEWNEFGEKYD